MDFEDYKTSNFDDCINLFNENCPKFFAENEREDYINYLKSSTDVYKVAYVNGEIVAAFGIGIHSDKSRGRITWIMVNPNAVGQGIGVQMMTYAKEFAREKKMKIIDISASHISEPFFEKFGASRIKFIHEGWGPDMHKVDMEIVL